MKCNWLLLNRIIQIVFFCLFTYHNIYVLSALVGTFTFSTSAVCPLNGSKRKISTCLKWICAFFRQSRLTWCCCCCSYKMESDWKTGKFSPCCCWQLQLQLLPPNRMRRQTAVVPTIHHRGTRPLVCWLRCSETNPVGLMIYKTGITHFQTKRQSHFLFGGGGAFYTQHHREGVKQKVQPVIN